MKEKDNVKQMEDNVNNIIKDAMMQLKNLVDVNTIIGEPINLNNNITLLPVSKINVGFVAGGGEMKCNLNKIKTTNYPFAGGSGSGFNVTPIGFLTINKDVIGYISIEKTAPYGEFLNVTNKIVSKLFKDKVEVEDEEIN